MKRSEAALIILFIIAFIIDSLLADAGSIAARYLSKGLLMPLLLAWFLVATKAHANNTNQKQRLYIAFALVFSCVGDIFLIGQGSLSFICG